HGAAGHVKARQIGARNVGGRFGQHAPLNLRRLRELARHDALRLFHLRQARVLDADGRDVGHHGEQAQIVLGEFAQDEGRVQVDQADDAVLGLQGHRHHGVHFLLHDAHAALEGVVQLGVAHQNRRALFEDAIAHGGADAEAISLVGAGDESVALQNHEHAALRVDRLDGQVQDHGEELVERPVLGEFLTRVDQRLHGGRRVWAAALDGHALVGERARQAGDYGGGGGRTDLAFEDDHVGGRVRRVGGEHDYQMAGGHAVAGFENQSGLEGNVVDEVAVLTAQVLHRPLVAFGVEREVLAGESGIFGKAKLGGAGAAYRQARPGDWNGFHLPIRTLDE